MAEYDLGEIKISLDDPSSIGAALFKINLLKASIGRAMHALEEYLLKEGVKIAKAQLVRLTKRNPTERKLYESIHSIEFAFDSVSGNGVAYITTDVPYAIYVEFGTGAKKNAGKKAETQSGVWKASLKLPNAKKAEPQPEPTTGRGWAFFSDEDGRWYTTHGQPPKPFMANTLYDLYIKSQDKAAELVKSNLPSF